MPAQAGSRSSADRDRDRDREKRGGVVSVSLLFLFVSWIPGLAVLARNDGASLFEVR